MRGLYALYIHLSIKNYLKEFSYDDLLSGIIMVQLLNGSELKVLREMRHNIKQIIIINTDNKNGMK